MQIKFLRNPYANNSTIARNLQYTGITTSFIGIIISKKLIIMPVYNNYAHI